MKILLKLDIVESFRNLKRLLLYAIFLLMACAASAAPTLKSFGLKKFESYDVARVKLLKQGWELDSTGFPKEPDYKTFPEVVCGRGYDAVCSVQFQKNGKGIMLYVKIRSDRLIVDKVFDDN